METINEALAMLQAAANTSSDNDARRLLEETAESLSDALMEAAESMMPIEAAGEILHTIQRTMQALSDA